jgi:hypothetical protein
MNIENTEKWVIHCMKGIQSFKLSDHEALLGAQNIWSNILVNAYDAYAKDNAEDIKPFDTILEIELDKLMGTLAIIRALMDDHRAKQRGENVIPFPSSVKQ